MYRQVQRDAQSLDPGQVTYTVMHPADRIYAPWTPEQAANLNGYQFSGAGHPFTCGVDTCLAGDSAVGGRSRSGRTVMLAAADGWECPACGWRQNWALRFMLDRSWERPGPWALYVTTPAVAAFPVVRALDRIRTCPALADHYHLKVARIPTPPRAHGAAPRCRTGPPALRGRGRDRRAAAWLPGLDSNQQGQGSGPCWDADVPPGIGTACGRWESNPQTARFELTRYASSLHSRISAPPGT